MKPIYNKLRYATGILMLGSALTLGLYGLSSLGNQSFADDDDDDEHNRSSQYTEGDSGQNLLSQELLSKSALVYQSECASCHLAYPPKLLPQRSWQAIMSTLPDHFGDDASLAPAVQADILAYLSGSAGNNNRMFATVADDMTPLRITELPYFTRKHREIPERMLKNNPQLSSLSQCDSCHQGAAKGQFDEDTVVIPGFGRWDD